jgi:hypothetical protein
MLFKKTLFLWGEKSMEKNQTQKDQIMIWISNKMFSEASTQNRFKKEAIKTHNKIIVEMARYFCLQDYLPLSVVSKFIMMEFFASPETARRYIDRIFFQKVFVYNEDEKIFYLPEDIKKQIDLLK